MCDQRERELVNFHFVKIKTSGTLQKVVYALCVCLFVYAIGASRYENLLIIDGNI